MAEGAGEEKRESYFIRERMPLWMMGRKSRCPLQEDPVANLLKRDGPGAHLDYSRRDWRWAYANSGQS